MTRKDLEDVAHLAQADEGWEKLTEMGPRESRVKPDVSAAQKWDRAWTTLPPHVIFYQLGYPLASAPFIKGACVLILPDSPAPIRSTGE
jgi:hypothetical protein